MRIGYKASAEQFAPGELAGYAVLAEELGLDSVSSSIAFRVVALPLTSTGVAAALSGGSAMGSHIKVFRIRSPFMMGRVLRVPEATKATRVRSPTRALHAGEGGSSFPFQTGVP